MYYRFLLPEILITTFRVISSQSRNSLLIDCVNNALLVWDGGVGNEGDTSPGVHLGVLLQPLLVLSTFGF